MGLLLSVTDKEMLDGMSIVGLNGFDCEMASGAVPAGIKKLLNDNIMKKDDEIMWYFNWKTERTIIAHKLSQRPNEQVCKATKTIIIFK